MAVHDTQEFGQLFQAFTNSDITAEERVRLTELAGSDVARRGAIAEVEAVQELLAVEVGMRQQVMQPVEPIEEADESFRRLARSAAAAEAKLRANLMHPTVVAPTQAAAATVRGRVFAIVLAVAAVVLIAVGIHSWNPAPGLSTGDPDNNVLGGFQSIDVTTLITDDSPELAWSEVEGSARVEASILDSKHEVVLRRSGDRRFSRWILTAQNLETLRQKGQLFLRVDAWNAAGGVVGGTRKPVAIEVR